MPCNRCGKCCRQIYLDVSPRSLRLSWLQEVDPGHREVRRKKRAGFITKFQEITVIYPMLRYRGYSRKWKRWIYDCRNLEQHNGGGVATCKIQNCKPSMCRDFPFLGKNLARLLGVKLKEGCGYEEELQGKIWELTR